MVKLIRGGVYYMEGRLVKESVAFMVDKKKQTAIKGTISYNILNARNTGSEDNLKLKFDKLFSDNYSGGSVIKLASALRIPEFKIPYVYNGTDLNAAKKFGFDYIPLFTADPEQYMCETTVKSGDLVLSSAVKTNCGVLGAMVIEDDCTDVVKQLLNKTYDIVRPQIIAVYLKGKPKKGVGPFDVALAFIGATYRKDFLKDCIIEFIGPGVRNISVDFRMELDALSDETGALASVWETDEAVEEYFKTHNRAQDYKKLVPAEPAYYDGAAVIDLSRIEPMIAVNRFDNVYTVNDFIERASEITDGKYESGNVRFEDAYISVPGCESILEACEILKTGNIGAEFNLTVGLQGLTAHKSLAESGCISALLGAGVDIDYNDYHEVDGNYYMDARTIAATAANGGVLTPATRCNYIKKYKKFNYDCGIYEKKVYRGYGKPQKDIQLDIAALEYSALPENVRFCVILDDIEEVALTDGAAYALAVEDAVIEDVYALKEDGFSAVITDKYKSLRYSKNLINWGILPFICRKFDFKSGDEIYIANITELVKSGCTAIPAKHTSGGKTKNIMLGLPELTAEEKKILLAGGLANFRS